MENENKDLNSIEVESENLVEADNICMDFKVDKFKVDTLKEKVIRLIKRDNKKIILSVLKDVSFKIKKGESLGVIGHNGAGKSTLLKIVAGIYEPTSGSIKTKGDIFLLNLGAGFDPEADAIENVFLSGAILGFSRKQMKEKLDSIIDFSELGNFTHMPLKNYSSGMISRLGFAIAINVKPDLLLVDEVLSVGDANFRKKCMEKILDLKSSGVSFMYVSHNISEVQNLCEKTLWIENSQVVDYGDSKDICKKYVEYCKKMQSSQNK